MYVTELAPVQVRMYVDLWPLGVSPLFQDAQPHGPILSLSTRLVEADDLVSVLDDIPALRHMLLGDRVKIRACPVDLPGRDDRHVQ